jgi:hypothetical protein
MAKPEGSKADKSNGPLTINIIDYFYVHINNIYDPDPVGICGGA